MRAFTPLLALTFGLVPGHALAHAGAHFGPPLLEGLAHPFTGADHVLAMLAVGLWATISGGRQIWAMPLTFVAALLMGAGFGVMGLNLPGVEPMIIASIPMLGVAAALAFRPPLLVALAGIALFGLVHGIAHGAEGPQAGIASYAIGLVLASASLISVGLLLGQLMQAKAIRAFGALTAVAGLALAFA